jgi:hypothetical protein
MLKTFWPNAESLFLAKRSGSGARNSGLTMPDNLKKNRETSVIPRIWTNSSSESTASSSTFGVPWTRMVMSSIFCYSLAAICVQPSGFFADCCAVKASNHFGSSPTS